MGQNLRGETGKFLQTNENQTMQSWLDAAKATAKQPTPTSSEEDAKAEPASPLRKTRESQSEINRRNSNNINDSNNNNKTKNKWGTRKQ